MTYPVSVLDFGADPTGTTDSTAAFNAALASFVRTSPPGINPYSPTGYANWGVGRLVVPKGLYLINGTVSVQSPIGLFIDGDGEYATALIRTIDSGAMFNLTTYICVEFARMSIHHNPVGARATWTNSVFSLNGNGGGRNLSLKHVTTLNFATVLKHTNTINEDTTSVDHCTFESCTTFLDSENTQAMINTFSNCSWGGDIDQVFWAAGHQKTLITSANVTTKGPMIRFKNVPGKYNDAGFTLINCKLEWTSHNGSAGSAPKFIDCVGDFITARVNMIDCSLFGGNTPNADGRFARIGAGACLIDIQGGQIEGKLEVVKSTYHFPEYGSYIKLTGVRLSDPSTWVYTEGASGGVTPPISLTDCRIGNKNPTNLSMGTVPFIKPRRTVVLGRPGQAHPYFGTETVNIDMPTYGQLTKVNSASVAVKYASNIAGRKVQVYSNAARTAMIGTFSLPSGALTNKFYDITLSNSIVTEGLFFVVTSTGSWLEANIVVDFTSI